MTTATVWAWDPRKERELVEACGRKVSFFVIGVWKGTGFAAWKMMNNRPDRSIDLSSFNKVCGGHAVLLLGSIVFLQACPSSLSS